MFTKKYKTEIENLKKELFEVEKQKDIAIDESSKLALTIVKLRGEIKDLKAQLKEFLEKKEESSKVTKTPKKTSKKTDKV